MPLAIQFHAFRGVPDCLLYETARHYWRKKMNKYAVYERIKAEIARTAKSAEEYEKRIKALQRKLKI